MEITAAKVKELRDKTGVGMMECKKALKEAEGDIAAAEKILRKRGVAAAAKKAGRSTGEGAVASYIHTGGKIGVLLEINCETDFAARSDDFQNLVHDLAMHVAAAAPRFVTRDEVTEEILSYEREIAKDQALKSGKPENIVEKIVDGKMNKFYGEVCLMEQAYVKNPDVTIEQLITELVARIGENIKVARFSRFVLGES